MKFFSKFQKTLGAFNVHLRPNASSTCLGGCVRQRRAGMAQQQAMTQQQAAQQQTLSQQQAVDQQKLDAYKRAFEASMEGKGYSVKW
ncbi:MAG: hypothetical protein JWQ71_1660 [Pedosphaera sp.]|nr:hypothetical protein [Pedosphaera sp.]